MTSCGGPSAILRPDTRTIRRCEKLITALMMCSIMTMVMPRSLSRMSSATMSVDLGMRQAGHGFVRHEQLGLGRHGARELELAHFHLGEVARQLVGLALEADKPQELGAALSGFAGRMPGLRPFFHRVDQGHAQIVGDRHAVERARQLEAARDPEPGAFVRLEPVDRRAGEPHHAGLVLQRTADAVDQRALARAIRTDQPDPLARRDIEADVVQRHEAAEALAQVFDLEQRLGHHLPSLRTSPGPGRPGRWAR